MKHRPDPSGDGSRLRGLRRLRGSIELLCAGVLWWAGAVAPVTAQPDLPRVYIVSVPMDDSIDAVATRGGAAVRAALREVEGVDWRGPDQRFSGYDLSALTVLERAREQLAQGRTAYLQLELELAVEALRGAIANFDAAAAALEDPEDLGQALLYLGASYAFNGGRREAMQVFRRLHTQMPHIAPDPDTFPPEVVQLFERSRPRDARRPSGTIAIDSSPQGAIVYVDFLARGRTPTHVEGLVEGEHVIRLTRAGAPPFVERVGVRARRTATSEAFLAETPGLEGMVDLLARVRGAPTEGLDADNPIRQLGAMLELDEIGVLRIRPRGDHAVSLEVLLYDLATGRRLFRGERAEVETTVGRFESTVQEVVSEAFAAALRPAQASDDERIPALHDTRASSTDPVAADSGPVTDEWWFWTIIGTLAVGALVGVGVGIAVATEGPALGADPGGQVVFTF